MRPEIKGSQAKRQSLTACFFDGVQVLVVRAVQKTKRLAKVAANAVLEKEGIASYPAGGIVKM